jgi:hypothetical protein
MRGPSGPQAQTVRTADRPASGPDSPPAQNGAQQIVFCTPLNTGKLNLIPYHGFVSECLVSHVNSCGVTGYLLL